MTLTFVDLYNECAGQPWSMFDNDVTSKEDFESAMRISINKAVSYLWNFQKWSFRLAKKHIKTKADRAAYLLPDGLIQKKTLRGAVKYSVKHGNKYLGYVSDYELLEDKYGQPESFYLDNDNIYIYPTPDATYQINVGYYKTNYAIDDENQEKAELVEDTDSINIPEKYEALFKNCAISLAMLYAIADESDENYSGYLNQYNNALNILIDNCKNGATEKHIVW